MNKTWIFADYSQAEARVVAWKGPVPSLKKWFLEGVDVHTQVARQMAKVVQENDIRMPKNYFRTKPWSVYGKGDHERTLAKNTVHGNNYGLGKRKFSLITGLPEKYAGVVQEIYHHLFPEVRSGYQAGIGQELRASRTLTTAQGWPRTFYDQWSEELLRAAYAFYPQSTVGAMLVKTLTDVCECFESGDVKGLASPRALRAQGLDCQLQIHDAIGVVTDDDPATVEYAVRTIKRLGEHPLIINGEELRIPMDFQVGPSWGELTNYYLPA